MVYCAINFNSFKRDDIFGYINFDFDTPLEAYLRRAMAAITPHHLKFSIFVN